METPVTDRSQVTAIRGKLTVSISELGAPVPPDADTPTPRGKCELGGPAASSGSGGG